MKYLIAIVFIVIFQSCSSSFINHEMKAERIGACIAEKKQVTMNSNINGERYVFEYCLGDSFDGKDYKVERKGDTLLVSFPKVSERNSLYKLTLDIDAKPPYHYILLGDNMLEIAPADR